MYIGDYLGRRCVYTPEKTALVDAGSAARTRLSFLELDQRANRLAKWLRSAGIDKGDRVGMLAHDGPHHYDAFFACGKLGAVFVPYNWRLHPEEVQQQIRMTTPRVLFHAEESEMPETVEHLSRLSQGPRLIPVRAESPPNLAEIVAHGQPDRVTCESLTEKDTACLLFTGGTTGAPKAAEISHGQIVWNTINSILGDVLAERFLNIFPLFHAGGLFAFSLPVLIQGGSVIQTRSFHAEEVLRLVEAEKITVLGGVPTIFQMLAEAPNWKRADLSSLRYCMSGGAAMPIPLIRKYQAEKGVVFRQGFGMTEFGPGVFSLASADVERKAGSIGKPNYFVDARVVRPETNVTLSSNEVGELVLRGPSAMRGYFNDPDATAKAFDDEGYFHTGDLARVDDDGYFYIVDRLKEMFISGGENVYPAEIEAVLQKHPAVATCAVVGVADPQWGQVGKAFVVRAPAKQVSEAELVSHLREHLAPYKLPKAIIFKENLPVSGAGKILKRELLDCS